MLSPANATIRFWFWYTKAKVGAAPSSAPTIKIGRKGSGTLIVNGGSLTASLCTGLYYYELASGSTGTADDYYGVANTSDTTVDYQELPALWIVGAGLDAAVSSRLAASSYVAPDNANIGAAAEQAAEANSTATLINNKIGGYTGSGASTVKGQLDAADAQQTADVSSILTALGSVPGLVWAYSTRTLTSFGTLTADVWDRLTTAITAPGSIGKFVQDVLNAIKGKTDNLPDDPADQSDLAALIDAIPTAEEIDAQLTDSHGDGSWQAGAGGGFTGSNQVTLNFKDAGRSFVPGVVFTVVGVGTAVAGTGSFVGGLNPGTYTVRAAPQSGVLWGDTSITVNADPQSFDLAGAAQSVGSPAAPTLCTAYGRVIGADGLPLAGAQVSYQLVTPPAGDGLVYTRSQQQSDASDATGLFTFDLLRGGQYAVWYARGSKVFVKAPDAASVELPQIVGE